MPERYKAPTPQTYHAVIARQEAEEKKKKEDFESGMKRALDADKAKKAKEKLGEPFTNTTTRR